VKQAAVAGFRLERVSDGVPQVQYAAQAAFALVSGNDLGLQFYRLRDETFELHRIALQDLGSLLFEAQKKIKVADDAALESFVQPGSKLAIGQRAQDFRIDEHSTGMMECSEQVLPCPEIHRGLATHRCIYLSKNRGGDLHQLHTAHVKRRQQAGNIANHPATQRNQNSFAVGAQPGQFFGQLLDRAQFLRRLSVRHLDYLGLEARRGERAHQLCAPAPAHRRNRNHEDLARLRQQLRQQGSGPRQQAVFNAGLVGPRRNMDGDLRHGNSIIAYGAMQLWLARPGEFFLETLPTQRRKLPELRPLPSGSPGSRSGSDRR